MVDADTYVVAAVAPDDGVAALFQEAVTLRACLLADAKALVADGVFEPARTADMRGSVGFQNVATDARRLAQTFRESWAVLAGRTTATLDDLDRADVVASSLLQAVGTRSDAQIAFDALVDARNRAFPLFFTAYNEARAALAYVR